MKRIALALVLGLALPAPAIADDAADCAAGIEMIKAEIAKAPPKETLDKLTKLLGDAEREAGEKEYDECFDAITDAKEAVGG